MTTLSITQSDPLGILESTRHLLSQARHARIVPEAIVGFVASFGGVRPEPPPWDSELHLVDTAPGGDERLAGWVFALDALNFCFWSTAEERWQVTWRGKTRNGYGALASSLCRAVEEEFPLWDPAWLRRLTPEQTAWILRADEGYPAIPLLESRHRHLQELGTGFGADTAADVLTKAGGSAIAVITEVLQRFPSFRDVAIGPDGQPVHFCKRAQILIADLSGALEGSGLARFDDLAELTAFADYKVPQVLRQLGILAYSDEATSLIRSKTLIAAGSGIELEIRSATIWGCELIRQALVAAGIELTSSGIDWLLWNAGQSLPSTVEPYHRTLTPFY
ncbi:MAG: queuosine salvage family protein [Thermomicrobiales bacterium]